MGIDVEEGGRRPSLSCLSEIWRVGLLFLLKKGLYEGGIGMDWVRCAGKERPTWRMRL